MLRSLAMAFSRSPHKLTRSQTLRVEETFPARLKAAADRAGVPNGVLLSHLVDEYLASEQPSDGLATAAMLASVRESVQGLADILGLGGVGLPAVADQINSLIVGKAPEPEPEPEPEPGEDFWA